MSRHSEAPWTKERNEGYLINGIIHVPDVYEEHHADANLIVAAPELLSTLQALCDAVKAERAAQDTYIKASGDVNDDTFDDAAEAYQDACATTIICEVAARAAIAKARGEE